jgi:hypothetical protein
MGFRLSQAIVLVSGLFLLFGCKDSPKKAPKKAAQINTPTGPGFGGDSAGIGAGGVGGSGSLDNNQITINSSAGYSLNAVVGQQQTWRFTASSSVNSDSISLRTTITSKPATMQIQGDGTSEVTVSWTPTTADLQRYESGTISLAASATGSSSTGRGSYSWTLTNGSGSNGGGISGNNGQSNWITLLPVIMQMFQGGAGGGAGDLDIWAIWQQLSGAGSGGIGNTNGQSGYNNNNNNNNNQTR